MSILIETPTHEKIALEVMYPSVAAGKLVILEHGLAGYKEEPMMRILAKSFVQGGYTVVTFDARYGLGESDGALEKANFTRFIEDLETVITWAKTQAFYTEPFALGGHSLGAGACFEYALRHPSEISQIVSLSAVVSGKRLLESYMYSKPEFVKQWQKDRLLYRERADDKSKKGFISYAHMEEALRYDLLNETVRLTCPVLVVCGDKDISSTVEINTELYDSLSGKKSLKILVACGHTYQTPQNQADLSHCLLDWLSSF